MSKFFLGENTTKQDSFKVALPDLIYLPLNIGRFIPRQQDNQNVFISPPSNSVNLTDWINHSIETGTIIVPDATPDGNGIYSGNGTIPDNTIARLGNSFGIQPTGASNQYNFYITPTSTQIGTATANNTYPFRLTLTETTATFTDTINYGGLKYASDYSANFTPLSLVTKQYVDGLVGGDGIYGGSGTIATNAIATLAADTYFYLGPTNRGLYMSNFAAGKVVTLKTDVYELRLSDFSGSEGAYFIDSSASPKGIQYFANYNSTFTNRSLVDKFYVDTLIDGRKWKQEVACATTAPITLSGEQTIDGVLTSSSRVLVKDQASTLTNGIYVSAAGAWTRATDADLAPELDAAAISVAAGTINGERQFYQTEIPVIIGTDANLWVPISSGAYAADGEGIELTGNEFGLELDGTTLSKSSSGLRVANSGITGTQLNVSVAGDGLIGGGGSPLAVGAGAGVTVTANEVSVTGIVGSPWTVASMLAGDFEVLVAGAFSEEIDVTPHINSNIMVQLRDVDNKVMIADIDTTVTASKITVSGIAPTNNYEIKYLLVAFTP